MKHVYISSGLFLWFITLLSSNSYAQDLYDPEEVFAYQGEQTLSQSEVDGAIHRIPEEHRLKFLRDGEKVQMMITSLMMNRMMATDASKYDLDKNPVIQERLKLAMEEELALVWRDELLKSAPEADYEALAYERYLSNQGDYMSKEVLDVSHILISIKERDYKDALDIAESVWSELVADPDKFEDMVIQYSEDPGKDFDKGRLESVVRGQTVKPFEHAAFGLKVPGQITRPVKTEFGYHLIRFNGRKDPLPIPFEKVKERLIAKVKTNHQTMYRDNYMSQLLSNPLSFPDGSVEIMIKRYFGEDLELAPDFYGSGTHTEDEKTYNQD